MGHYVSLMHCSLDSAWCTVVFDFFVLTAWSWAEIVQGVVEMIPSFLPVVLSLQPYGVQGIE